MAKRRVSDPIVRNREVKEALGDAFTRALHWLPDTMLADFEGEGQGKACRRLALRVAVELAADGWRELRPRLDLPGLDDALVIGMKRAGKTILRSLPVAARCCNKKMLDNVGFYLGELAFEEMMLREIAVERFFVQAVVDMSPYRNRQAG